MAKHPETLKVKLLRPVFIKRAVEKAGKVIEVDWVLAQELIAGNKAQLAAEQPEPEKKGK